MTTNEESKTYKIIRFFYRSEESKVLKEGLTLEEAQEHCNDPETSSRTALSAEAKKRTEKYGPWFDGYSEER